MARLERNYAQQLAELSERIQRLAGMVEQAIDRSIDALVHRDEELAEQVIADDAEIDRLELEIDQQATEILALYQPTASDLRFITTAMKITPDLERMADLACNISERALELTDEPPLRAAVDIPLMAAQARSMVRDALNAFVSRDAIAAREVCARDDELDDRNESVFRELLSYMLEDPRTIGRAIRLTFVAKYLERIGDQASNICEMVVYLVEGKVIKHSRLDEDEAEIEQEL